MPSLDFYGDVCVSRCDLTNCAFIADRRQSQHAKLCKERGLPTCLGRMYAFNQSLMSHWCLIGLTCFSLSLFEYHRISRPLTRNTWTCDFFFIRGPTIFGVVCSTKETITKIYRVWFNLYLRQTATHTDPSSWPCLSYLACGKSILKRIWNESL